MHLHAGKAKLGHCAGLDWVAPGWTGLRQSEPGCAGLDWVAPGCVGLRQTAPGCAGLHQVVLGWTGLRQSEPGCAGLRQSEPACTGLNWRPGAIAKPPAGWEAARMGPSRSPRCPCRSASCGWRPTFPRRWGWAWWRYKPRRPVHLPSC